MYGGSSFEVGKFWAGLAPAFFLLYISRITRSADFPPMEYISPEFESGIPLPANAAEAMPDLSPREEIEMRARTIKMLSDLSGNPILPKDADMDEARQLAHQFMTDPSQMPQLAQYSNPTLAYLAGMVAQHDTYIVQELADLKKFIVNRLVAETEDSSAKVRLGALRMLGEIDGVDAFKKRTEVTHKVQSIEEVEKELLETLAKLERRTVDVEVVEVKRESDA